jgi:hypothetical protein
MEPKSAEITLEQRKPAANRTRSASATRPALRPASLLSRENFPVLKEFAWRRSRPSFRVRSGAEEPGIHEHWPPENGFWARRCCGAPE